MIGMIAPTQSINTPIRPYCVIVVGMDGADGGIASLDAVVMAVGSGWESEERGGGQRTGGRLRMVYGWCVGGVRREPSDVMNN
jgi:hypothetical protein